MQLTIRLFGPEAVLANAGELVVPVENLPITCAALRRRVAEREPRLADSLRTARFAVNHEFASDELQVRPGDEVALIGSVSGG
jgi:molybdopterin converting factor small subunit